MSDTTVKKVSSATSPKGEHRTDLPRVREAGGDAPVARRAAQADKPAARRDYETIGYVIAGRAELTLEGQTLRLEPGDAWLVPAGAGHAYRILEPFTAVEATAPPAQAHGRDQTS